MITKLSRHGDGLALVIDQPMLDMLRIDADTALEISANGESLVVVPVRDAERVKRFEEALASTNARYEKTLKRLAE